MPRTILIHACNEQRLGAQLDAVADLARADQAHLVGVAVLPAAYVLPAGVPGASDTVTIDTGRRASRAAADRMRIQFLSAATRLGARAEWILGDAERAGELDQLSSHAHAADLIVASPVKVHWLGGDALCAAELLILASGRPVVVVPRAIASLQPIGHRVVVAWNGSRESARAIADAVPLLRKAAHVKVLTIRAGPPPGERTPSRTSAIAAMLARHGIRIETEEIALGDVDVGPALLSATKAENADLLVMGFKARWRFSDLLVSGASRHVLATTHVPVLMAH